MADLIRNTLKSLFRSIPLRRRREEEESGGDIEIISSPLLGEINYGCDGCFQGIKEGDLRYNCNECVESFDLCKSCYEGEPGRLHRETMGHLHEFTCETRSNYAIAQDVKGDTLEETLANMFKYYADRHAIGTYVTSRKQYEYIRFRELEQLVSSCASALHHIMLPDSYNRMVAICSVVRLEWYVFDYACALIGIPTVGITASSDVETVKYILNQTESSVVACSFDHLNLFVSLIDECPNLREIIVMDMKEDEKVEIKVNQYNDIKIKKLTDFLAEGFCPLNVKQIVYNNESQFLIPRTDPSQIYTICYTSGSTGKPKGCVFTRELWLRQTQVLTSFSIMSMKRLWFSFQPPSHMMERESFHLTLLSGFKAGIYRGSMEHLFDDIRMVEPTIVTSTPRFFSIIHNQFLQSLYEEYQNYLLLDNNEKETEVMSLENVDSSENLQVTLSKMNIPSEVREKTREKFKHFLGSRIKLIGVGGAAVSRELKSFISFCFEGLIEEGYGATEVGGITSGNWCIANVEFRLRDVPEMGYFTTDQPPRGELCVKTPYMISGYYKNQEETSEKFQDGFFCTGDIVELKGFSNVEIIDRKKNIFKLAQGEFVAPERLELIFENGSNLIEQVYIYGNIYQNNVVAVIVPHKEGLLRWCQGSKIKDLLKGFNDDDFYSNPIIYDYYMSELRTIGETNKLNGWEIPSAILIEPHPFAECNHLLTSTLKKSRPQLEKKYKTRLESLYKPTKSDQLLTKRSIEEDIFTCLLHILKRKGIDYSSSKYYSIDFKCSIDLNLTLTQLGEDSLTSMRLSNILEQELGVNISAVTILTQPVISLFKQILSSFSPSQTIDITDIPSSAVNSTSEAKSIIDWDNETSIQFLEVCASLTKVQSFERKGPNVVLLTGSTGFLGKFILLELLKSKNCSRVYCLVRKTDNERSASDRMTFILKELQIELANEGIEQYCIESKLVTLEGDLSQSQMGLDLNDFTRLLTEIDVVIHNGAHVNHILSYADLKPANVQCTKEIIKFCCQKKPKYLHFVSSLGVFALSPMETFDENSIPNKERLCYLSGYSQTKWVSENVVMKSISSGFINGSISRPGLIGAHSKTGHSNRKDWFYQLVQGLYHLGCYPVGASWDGSAISIVPVDVVAKSVVHLAFSDNSNHGTFHLNSRNPHSVVTFKSIINALKRLDLDTQIQPLGESAFMDKLSQEAKVTRHHSVSALHMLLSNSGRLLIPETFVDNSLTCTFLKSAGIQLNVSNDGYMDNYIQYLQMRKLL